LLKHSAIHGTHGHTQIAGLYQRYAPEFLLYIRCHVPSQEDAEDVLLEVFIAALENPSFSEMSEQEQLAWLQRVARNKYVDFHRRSTRRPSIPLEDVQQQLYDEDDLAPELIALKHEEHALLHTYLASLPETQQEVLHLRSAEDLRCPEIARRLDKSDGAIRTTLSRILNLLRNIYINSEKETSNG
jgi:RNA polymerase sigma factor (sigma-70 family)